MYLLAQLTEYVSAYLLLYDHLILHSEKVPAWIVQFSLLLQFHNVRMSCSYSK